MPCVLRVQGENLDVEAFQQKLSVNPISLFRKGDAIGKKRIHQTNGLKYSTSEAGFEDFSTQINETVAFLEKHTDEIRLASQDSRVESMTLDFGFDTRILNEEVEIQVDSLPPRLIQLAGQLEMGIELSQYMPS